MKPLFLLVAALLAGPAAHAQQALALATPAPGVAPTPAAIAWKATTHQFGEIKQGVPVTASFTFTNQSKKPVLLTDVRASCGCTVPAWSKEPVLPGQSAVVSATYNAASPGVFTKVLTVTTSADTAGPQTLLLQGTVLAKAAE